MTGKSLQSSALQYLETTIIVVALVFVVLGAYARSFGDTANSRLATVAALAEFGTWYIDRPPGEPPISFEERTIDKVVVGGRTLSSKPPILPLLMTGEYLLLNRVFGWSLDDENQTHEIIRYMSMLLIGLPFVLTLVFFVLTAKLFVEDPLGRVLALFGLAFCTQLLGYGTNINNHVPAACLLMISLYFGLGLAAGKLAPKPWRFIMFGVMGGLVPTMDMPAGIFVLLTGLYLVAKWPRQSLIWAAAGMALPLAVHFYITYTVTGSLFPVQLRRELYLSEASYWRNPRGIDALNEPKLVYLFHITFGRCGLFSLYPITIIGLVTSLVCAVKGKLKGRPELAVGLLGFLSLLTYYTLHTNNYGGEAYGFRWFIVAMPILMLMGTSALSRATMRWQWIVVALLMGISYYSSWQCTVTPWRSSQEWTCRFYGPSY